MERFFVTVSGLLMVKTGELLQKQSSAFSGGALLYSSVSTTRFFAVRGSGFLLSTAP